MYFDLPIVGSNHPGLELGLQHSSILKSIAKKVIKVANNWEPSSRSCIILL